MKEYICLHTDASITIDGNVQKPQWDKAEKLWLSDVTNGAQPKQSTWAKAVWDNEKLYFAFFSQDSYVKATMKNYNDLIFNEEVVEVFIGESSKKGAYTELEVNPLNAVLHYYIINSGNGNLLSYARTEQVVDSAVIVNSEENWWSAEFSIPLKEFFAAPNMPPKCGDEWNINFYRIDRPESGEDEYSAWCPTGKVNFHCPESFGKLVFK